MRSANPALNANSFANLAVGLGDTDRMSLQGTVIKSMGLLLLVVAAASWSWKLYFASGAGAVMPLAMGGALVGMGIAIVTIMKKTWAPFTAPLYAVAEGVMLGAMSGIVQAQFPDQQIVAQAVGLTFGTFGALLLAYTSGMIKPSENFRLGLFAATGGIMLLYLATMVLGFFGVSIPFIHGSGPIGIGFSLFVVVIAALNLVLDFDFIENGVEAGAPKYMEWYAAFGLLVTLVWLYIEYLRLLAKLASSRR